MGGKSPRGEVTERNLVHGWASAPGVRVRQAAGPDLPSVAKLAALAGVPMEDHLASAVTDGTARMALRAGLRGGPDGFGRYMTGQFRAHPDDVLALYLAAALVLVASTAAAASSAH